MAFSPCPKCGRAMASGRMLCEACAPAPSAPVATLELAPNLIQCPDCGREVSARAGACPQCGAPIAPTGRQPASPANMRQLILVGAFVLAIVLALGNFHIVRGGSVGVAFVPKAAFTFRETFPVMEEITGVPYITAVSRYPLAVTAMQRNGMLESNDARNDRVRGEIQREAEAETQRLMRQFQ